MELAGGAGFYRANGLERRFRDIQGARFHPLQPGAAGRLCRRHGARHAGRRTSTETRDDAGARSRGGLRRISPGDAFPKSAKPRSRLAQRRNRKRCTLPGNCGFRRTGAR